MFSHDVWDRVWISHAAVLQLFSDPSHQKSPLPAPHLCGRKHSRDAASSSGWRAPRAVSFSDFNAIEVILFGLGLVCTMSAQHPAEEGEGGKGVEESRARAGRLG